MTYRTIDMDMDKIEGAAAAKPLHSVRSSRRRRSAAILGGVSASPATGFARFF